MTRALTAAYFACLFFAAYGPAADLFTVAAPAVGFFALTRAACRLTQKGCPRHD